MAAALFIAEIIFWVVVGTFVYNLFNYEYGLGASDAPIGGGGVRGGEATAENVAAGNPVNAAPLGESGKSDAAGVDASSK